jgi:hypothetical protein
MWGFAGTAVMVQNLGYIDTINRPLLAESRENPYGKLRVVSSNLNFGEG